MKIEKLTPKQEKQLIAHREEYLKLGLSCEPINKELATKSIAKMYSLIGKKEPYFWFCDSHLQIQLVIQVLKQIKLEKGANLRANLVANLRANLRDNLGANLGANLVANLRANLGNNLRDNLGDNLRANLGDNLRANLGDNLRANLRDNLWDNLGANLRDNLGANLWDSDFWGQMDMYWIAYYQYPSKYLGLDYKELQETLNLWDSIGRSCNWWYPYENICFISDRPKEIQKNERGQLHADGKPALLFRDGYCLWMLNGVAVPEYLVMTPESNLDIEFFKKEKNADIRTEFVRKFGIQRMLSMGKKIDDASNHENKLYVDSEYEVYDMGNILDGRYRPYLKMKNLTTGVYHVEGIHPDCKTVEDALRYRAKNRSINLQGVK